MKISGAEIALNKTAYYVQIVFSFFYRYLKMLSWKETQGC